MDIRDLYGDKCQKSLSPTAERLESFLKDCLVGIPRIDRVSVRVKSLERFVAKAEKINVEGDKKYSNPLSQIQDQIGARIICFYLEDIEVVSATIQSYFNNIENRTVEPNSVSKFGYFGKHFILHYPDEVVDCLHPPEPGVFELQIKTLFQHAWSEAEHDLCYKPSVEVPADVQRKIAFTAAQAWGADKIFSELFLRLQAANDA